MPSEPRVKGFGEFALRVNDLEKMKTFYRDVVGLPVFKEYPRFLVFFEVAPGIEGHPQVFALFDREASVEQTSSTLDHFAFTIDLADYDAHKKRLEELGVPVFPKTFPDLVWRSLFFYDPEGNTVEFVTYDPTVGES